MIYALRGLGLSVEQAGWLNGRKAHWTQPGVLGRMP
jgi:hypothetical protein